MAHPASAEPIELTGEERQLVLNWFEELRLLYSKSAFSIDEERLAERLSGTSE